MRIFDWFYVRMYPLDGLLLGAEWDWYHKYIVFHLFVFKIIVDLDLSSQQLKHLG